MPLLGRLTCKVRQKWGIETFVMSIVTWPHPFKFYQTSVLVGQVMGVMNKSELQANETIELKEKQDHVQVTLPTAEQAKP